MALRRGEVKWHSRPQAGRDGAPGHAAGMNEPPFTSFCEAVRELLDESAADKGYQGRVP